MELVELTEDSWPSLETLLAIEDGEPLGWVAVAPRSTYPRLDNSTITRSDAGPGTWSVTCFFVHRTARRRGVAATLVARRGTRRALVRREL